MSDVGNVRRITGAEWACVLLCSAFMALFYQKGAGWPITDMFPLIERLLDPGYLPHDFYTNTLEAYSGRHYTARLFHAVAAWLGVDYRLVVGWSNLPRLFLTGIGTYLLMRALLEARDETIVAFFLGTVSFFVLPVFIGYHYVDNYNTGHSLSLMCMLPAWATALRDRPAVSLWLLALAIVFHPVNGAHGLAIAVCMHAARHGPGATLTAMIRAPVLLAAAALAAAVLAHYLPYRAAVAGTDLPAAEFVAIIGHLRHPHHYIPSQFAADSWWVFLGLVLCMLGMLRHAQLGSDLRRVLAACAGYVLTMMLVGYLFVELWPHKWITSLQPYRALLIFPPLFLAVLACYLRGLWQRRAWGAIVLLCLPFVPVRPYSAGMNWLLADPLTLPRICLFFTGFVISLLAWERAGRVASRRAVAPEPGFAPGLAVWAAIFALPLVLWSARDFRTAWIVSAPREPVYRYLRNLVPGDAVILAETRTVSNQLIRLYARRAVAASRDFPFVETHFREWARRYRLTYRDQQQHGRIDAMDDAELDRVADQLAAEYVVRSRPLRPASRLLLVYALPRGGRWGRNVFLYHNELPAPDRATATAPR